MTVFKCKMCGGNLEVKEGMTVCECEYCGSIQTVPQLDDEKKINLFSRANRLRSACEFDKAAGVYESIITEFPEEAEAYWGLILCKYGIEYVDDPRTGKKIPTCHRSSFDSVMDDENFDMVMEYSDPASRSVYRNEAKAIEALRMGIIEVSSKEEPYDIFICYKETDAAGERTLDSVIAQDVYEALTEKGYKVFFSRITLEDKLGQEYEPYIFAALNSAKIMLAFGTDYEYYNAVWVKNEWSRFLSLIEKGAKKTLIPCYKGIDAYDMPKEFARLQAQDMGKVGAIQDLLRGIGKILGEKPRPVAAVNIPASAGTEADTLIQRGNMSLEDGDFKNAENYFERALDVNPTAARAYLGKFLAKNRLNSLDDLKETPHLIDNSPEFKRARQFADSVLTKEFEMVIGAYERKIAAASIAQAIRRMEEKKALRESMALLKMCNDGDFDKALQLFEALEKGKCINAVQAITYRRLAESEYFVLKKLREKLEVMSLSQLTDEAKKAEFPLRKEVLGILTENGLIEQHENGYCWPGALENKQQVLEELEKQNRQKEAFEEACAEVNRQIEDEIASEESLIDEQYAPALQRIQRQINSEAAENERQRDALQRQIEECYRKQNSLGLFKVKEKFALHDQIVELQAEQSKIATRMEIAAVYKNQIMEINQAKEEALEKAKAKIRAKYTMPKFEDFQNNQ